MLFVLHHLDSVQLGSRGISICVQQTTCSKRLLRYNGHRLTSWVDWYLSFVA